MLTVTQLTILIFLKSDTLEECLIKNTTTGEMTARPCDAAGM